MARRRYAVRQPREAEHALKWALQALQVSEAEVVLGRLHTREPVVVRIADVDPSADSGDLGPSEAAHQLANGPAIHQDIESTETTNSAATRRTACAHA